MSTARVVADRYTVIRPIGRGSGAVVYVAKDRRDGSMCALKLVNARLGIRPDEIERFRTDVTRTLDHPGITPILDAGLDADGVTLYLTMPLLHGATLRDRLADRLRGDLERRLDILERALDPIGEAHYRGRVHGDLTPSNVFEVRSRRGVERVTLLDLGLAEILERYAAPGTRVGAARFMAPERHGGESASPASDVWSFGVMLYEAVTDKKPFEGLSQSSMVRTICSVPHRPVDMVAPEVDGSVARLVDACLEKHPGNRPPDARALLRLFKSLRSGLGSQGGMALDTILDHAGAAPPPAPAELDAALRRNPRDPQTHRAMLAYYENQEIDDGAWLAASALDFLGAASREELHLSHKHRQRAEIEHDRGLDAGGWAALLHPDQDPRIDAVWSEIVPALAALHRRTDEALELDEERRVPLSSRDELAVAFRSAVGTFRPGGIPRLYRGPPGAVPKHLPASPPTSVFPRGFEEPLPGGALAFAVGRHVAYYRASHRACTMLREPGVLESVFDAGVRIGLDLPAETTDQQRMVELLSERLNEGGVRRLRKACAGLGTSIEDIDLGTWRRAVELSCCRAGLTLGRNLEGAAWTLRWTRERQRVPSADIVDDLLRYWSSGVHVRVRHLLDIAVD